MGRSNAKTVVTLGILFNLSLLGFFKYSDFFLGNLKLVSGFNIPLLKLTLPLAVSFYTFQQITYLVDIYRGSLKKSGFSDYCFYIIFFPQLIAGPIVRYHELMPQFSEKVNRYLNWHNIAAGLFVFSMGLFKKVIIADSFAVLADAGFKSGIVLSILEAWAVSLSYTFQIYFDFSGYSDMAIGAALMFNLCLPINFNSPYKALNIQSFWQRWHITLSRWLRDYLYIPMGGNRKGTTRTLINIFVTFLLGGLWHGAGWTFVFWGAMHGAALGLHRIWQKLGKRMPIMIAWFITFMFVNFAWVFFRAINIPHALGILKSMCGLNGVRMPIKNNNLLADFLPWDFMNVAAVGESFQIYADRIGYTLVLLFSLIVFAVPNSMQIINFVPYSGRFEFKTDWINTIFLAVLLFVSLMTFLGNVTPGKFLYFNF